MKKAIFTLAFVGLTSTMNAQDTYLNDRITNSSNDLYGTSRYVGMGGALGALGADISTIGWNPAGIGMMRKNDINMTFGALWDKKGIKESSKTHGTFDQAGFVYSCKLGDDSKMKYINFGFNYQKKLNYNNAFYADNPNLKGLSQMDQFAELVNAGYDTDYNMAGFVVDENYLTKDGDTYYNKYGGESNYYTQKTWGGLHGFDINISGNVNDRAYWGVTVGIDYLRYRSSTDLYEKNSCIEGGVTKYGDYSLFNDQVINGCGMNFKFGTIVRPFEESPFRLGFVIETPTWYNLKSSTLYSLHDQVDNVRTKEYESYLEYAIRTPWKVRLSAATTIGSKVAMDVDYEFANVNGTSMGYPNDDIDSPSNSLFNTTKDISMNQQTKDNLKGMHTVRAGIEYRATNAFSLRLGYNYSTCAYKDNITFDQYSLDSYAMNVSTSTSYMKMGATNTLTLGMGYKWKHIYVDLAYKLRNQSADFYAFDSSFTQAGSDFAVAYPELSDVTLDPVNVDLTRHQLTATVGIKF